MPTHLASYDEAESSESTPTPQHEIIALLYDKPNQWYVDGQYQVYRDVKVLNDKGVMTRLVTVERKVLTGSLHTVPNVHGLFTHHRLEWMARSFGKFSEEIVQQFYVSYVTTLRCALGSRSKPARHDPLTSVLVRGFRVDISPITFPRFLYGTPTNTMWDPITLEFYYRWGLVKSDQF